MSKTRVSQNAVPSNRNTKVLPNPHNQSSSSSLTPRGEPWNHKQFLKRVETFNSLKWHIKRVDVNPLLCARFGWKCIAKNTLQCTECSTKINYKTNRSWSAETNNKAASAFLHNISFAHNPQCIWKKNPCHKSFEYLPVEPNLIKQQLIDNIKSWTQRDSHSFYLIPKMDENAKQLMLQKLPSNVQTEGTSAQCGVDIVMLSACGWRLNCVLNEKRYIECRYCNKCLSFQSYDYCKVASLMTDLDQTNENRERPNIECDISSILNEALPINDTESVIHRLSKLGLKIDSNVCRSHSYHIYETKSLQKQAHFTNATTGSNEKVSKNAPVRPFGSLRNNVLGGSFGCNTIATFGGGNTSMVWPKKSILQSANKWKNKKRSRNEMLKEMDDDNENEKEKEESEFLLEQCPRKKIRTALTNTDCVESNQSNQSNQSKKNRKRKSMDFDCEQTICSQFDEPILKKRKTIAVPSSTNLPVDGDANVRKKRKRKYADVFGNSDEMKESGADEDDDIGDGEQISIGDCEPPTKRVRVAHKACFDPIQLHNNHCPFVIKHRYQQKDSYGWSYCLTLVPNDIVLYIKHIIHEQLKKN